MNWKRMSCFILAAALLLSLGMGALASPDATGEPDVTASSEEPVASVTAKRITTDYDTIEDAWDAAIEKSLSNDAVVTVRVLTDVTAEHTLKVTGGARIRLVTLGTLTANINVGREADWAATEDELIFASGDLDGRITMYGGTLTVEYGASVEGTGIGVNCYWGTVRTESGSEISGGDTGIAVHATTPSGGNTLMGRLSVSGGRISGGTRYGIAVVGGTAELYGGRISGVEAGIAVDAGTLDLVEDSAISGPTGILVDELDPEYPVTVNITGGDIEGIAGPALQVDAENAKDKIALSDGVFMSTAEAIVSSAPVDDLLAEGFVYYDEEGTRLPFGDKTTTEGCGTVQVLSAEPVAEVAYTVSDIRQYNSIDQAWEEAVEDGWATVRLLKDTKARYTLWVEDGAHITLDGNGHRLSADINVSWDESWEDMVYTDDELEIESCDLDGMISIYGGSVDVGEGAHLSSYYIPINCYYGYVTVHAGASLAGEQDGICIHGGWNAPDGGTLEGQLKVYGGTISGERYGIFQPGGTVSIVDGDVSGDEAGLYVDVGTTTVEDGNISGGMGIYVDELTASEPVELNIYDGTITGTSGPALKLEEKSTDSYKGILHGGAFKSESAPVIQSENDPVSTLLADGLSYFDDKDAPMTPAADALALDEAFVTVHGADPVAEVTAGGTTTQYTIFKRAWDAAVNAEGGQATLTLLADVTERHELQLETGGTIVFEGGEHTLTLEDALVLGPANEDDMSWTSDLLIMQSGTIDGSILVYGGGLTVKGGTITSKSHTVIDYYGPVTVDGGTVSTTRTDGRGVAVGVHSFGEDGGVLTVNGGTLSAGGYGISSVGGTVTVNGGTVTGVERGINASGDTTITGGRIEATAGPGVAVDGYDSHPARITITGGTIVGTGEPGLVAYEYCDVSLSGGTFTGDPAVFCSDEDYFGDPMEQPLTVNDLLAEGCGYFDEDDIPMKTAADQTELAGLVTVHGTKPVAEVAANGETAQYASIDEAWAAANDAGGPAVLTLLDDVTVESLDVTGGADITFRGGEHTLTVTEVIGIGDPSLDASEWAYTSDKLTVESGRIDGGIYMFGGSLAVSGGTIECDGNTVICYWGDVTVNSGAVIAHGYGAIAVHDGSMFGDTDVIGRVTVNGGTVSGGKRGILCAGSATVNGGTVSGSEHGIYNWENGSLTVNGGTITGGTGVRAGESPRAPHSERPDGGTIAITGGKIEGTDGPGLDLEDNSTVTLSGGAFSGAEGAIHCEPYSDDFFLIGTKLTVSDLLAEGRGYFDSADKRVTTAADQIELAGPVTVH